MATQEKTDVPVRAGGRAVEKASPRVVGPFDEVERFFEQLMPRSLFPSLRLERPLFDLGALGIRSPRLDVIDRDDEVVVKAEVPGVKKDDVHVSVAGNTLTIKGETRLEEKEEKGDYYRCEISHGAFMRIVALSAEVDEARAKASMKDGMPELTLPKVEKSKRQRITIS